MGDFRVVRRSPRPTRQSAIRWNARRQRLLGGEVAQTVGQTGTVNGSLTVTDETIYPIFENFDPDAGGAGPADGIGGVVIKDNNGKGDPKIKISNLKGRYGDKSWLGLINTELFDGSGNFDECAEFMWINRATTTHTDFTIEAWIFPFDAHDATYRPIMCGGTLDTQGSFSTNSGSFWLRGQDLGFNVNTTTLVSANDVVPYNQWSHVAISRSGTTNRLYVDGVQVATATSGTAWQWDGGKAFIGSGPCANPTGIGSVRPFYGFMDDVVFHDSAVYTTTPVDVPASYADYSGQLANTITFPPISGTHLFHFDFDYADSFAATNGTPNSNGGEVALSQTEWRFGGQSMRVTNPSFTDTGGNYFNTGINLGTQAFAVDFWMYCDFAAGNLFDIAVCGGRAGSGDGAHKWGLRFRDNVDDEWELDHTDVAAVVSNTEGTSPLGGWAHVAIWRGVGDDADGNSVKWRILLPDYNTGATGEQNDGNWWASSTAGFHTADFGTLVFGGDNSDRDASSLYIEEVRVVLGTEAETMWRCEDPPLTRLEPYRTTNANPFFSKVKAQVDVVGGAITERVWNIVGDNDSTGLWEEDGGELSVDSVVTKSGNGSIKYDQGDTALAQGRNYVQVSNRLGKQYNIRPEEAYTLEGWIRPKDYTAGTDSGTMRRMHIFGFGDDWGDTVGECIGVYINFFEVPAVVVGFVGEFSNSGGTVITPDTWHHVALVRDEGPEGNHRLYLDGTLHHSFVYATELNLYRFPGASKDEGYSPHMYIGAAAGGINNTPYDFYGNIEGVLFTVGESKYAANFTPADSNPAPQATAPSPSDDLFASVEALIRPNGNRTAALVDVSNNAYTITQSAGSLATSDDSAKRHNFGHNTCVNVGGVSQITPTGADSQFTDFTIEHLGYIYSASGVNQGWFEVGTLGSLGYLRCQMDTNNPEHIDVLYRNSLDTADITARFETTDVIPLFDTGEVVHLVVQRDGNYPAVALNGTWLPDDLTRDANDQLPATLGVSGGTWDIIGTTTGSSQRLWTEGVRFTKANRYTVGTNFTKPNERFPEK